MKGHYKPTIIGFSFSEVLVSLAISAILASLALQLFISSKQHFCKNHQILQRMLGHTTTLRLLREKIFMAGYTPLGSLKTLHSSTQTSMPLTLLPAPRSGFITRSMAVPYYAIDKQSQYCIRLDGRAPFRAKQRLVMVNAHHYQVASPNTVQRNHQHTKLCFAKPLQSGGEAFRYVSYWLEERFELKNKKGPVLILQHNKHSDILERGWKDLSMHAPENGNQRWTLRLTDTTQQSFTLSYWAPHA